ncbi:hypothetical protein Droror1_Dr00004020 [Drosera rotundifolia]
MSTSISLHYFPVDQQIQCIWFNRQRPMGSHRNRDLLSIHSKQPFRTKDQIYLSHILSNTRRWNITGFCDSQSVSYPTNSGHGKMECIDYTIEQSSILVIRNTKTTFLT